MDASPEWRRTAIASARVGSPENSHRQPAAFAAVQVAALKTQLEQERRVNEARLKEAREEVAVLQADIEAIGGAHRKSRRVPPAAAFGS